MRPAPDAAGALLSPMPPRRSRRLPPVPHPAPAGSDSDDGSDSDSYTSSSSGDESDGAQHRADNNQQDSSQPGKLSGQKRKATAAERAERKRTRNNLFKPVRKHQRCGQCQTCLNPRMKKACLTVRAKQEQELRRHGGQQEGAGEPRQQRDSAASAQQYAVQKLQPLLDRWGKLEPGRVADFVRQLSEITPRMYQVYLTIITVSSSDVLRALAHSEALPILRGWLAAAQQKQKYDRILSIIKALEFIPVDRESLQRSQIGRALNEIKKACKDEQRVQTAAAQLVAKWKEAVLGDRYRLPLPRAAFAPRPGLCACAGPRLLMLVDAACSPVADCSAPLHAGTSAERAAAPLIQAARHSAATDAWCTAGACRTLVARARVPQEGAHLGSGSVCSRLPLPDLCSMQSQPGCMRNACYCGTDEGHARPRRLAACNIQCCSASLHCSYASAALRTGPCTPSSISGGTMPQVLLFPSACTPRRAAPQMPASI